MRAKVTLRHGIEGVIGKSSIVHPRHRMDELRRNSATLRAFSTWRSIAQRQRLDSLKQQKSVEWRERRARVALADGPAARHISGVAK